MEDSTDVEQVIRANPDGIAASTPTEWLAKMQTLVSPTAATILSDKRKDGHAKLDAVVVPSRRQEAWRFSNLNILFGDSNLGVASPKSSASVTRADFEDHLVDACAGAQLVFVDGLFSETLSDMSKLDRTKSSDGFAGTLTGLAAMDDPPPFLLERALTELDFLPEISYAIDPRTCSGSASLSALNQACVGEVALVSVGEGESLPHVQVVFVTSGLEASINYPRCLVLCGAGMDGELEVTQSYVTVNAAEAAPRDGRGSFTNGLTRVVMEEGTKMKHTYLQEAAANGLHYDCVYVDIKGDKAKHHLQTMSLGAYHSRINYDAVINGEDALAKIDCVFLASEKQSMDMHSAITHKALNSLSEQQHRNIVCDRAEAVFKGRIRVEQLAQGTNSDQLCRSLLLTDGAKVTMMPSMEIIADQVKCAHGATVADLSDEQMFYLQSRGFTANAARAILLRATVFEFAAKLPCPKAQARVALKIDDVVSRMRVSDGAEFASI